MRSAKFSEADIIATGKALEQEGKDVSPNAIKIKLGGGNPARIKKVWNDYIGDAKLSEPLQSKLDRPLSPDEKFALQIDLPIRNAATKVETVFELLLDELKGQMSQNFHNSLGNEVSDRSYEVGQLKSKLKWANEELAQVKRYRIEEQQLLWKKERENRKLTDTVDRLTRQLNELQNNKST